MAYEFDRRHFFPDQPSLAEMTKKSIELLSRNPKGFFLFVEGSKIDWAAHGNDPVGVISDVLAFDEAVGVAIDFAEKDMHTLIIAVADHGTGGMSLGNRTGGTMNSKAGLDHVFGPLKKAVLTGEGVEIELGGNRSETKIRDVFSRRYGIDDLTSEEIQAIQNARTGRMACVAGPMMSVRSHIGWSTNGHTGEDLFAYFHGIRKPMGIIENTEIARIIALAFEFDLESIDRSLFIDAEIAFGRIGAAVEIDRTVGEKPVLNIRKEAGRAQIPASTNIMNIVAPIEKTHTLPGISLFIPTTGRVYVPKQAVLLFERVHEKKR